MRFSFAKAWFVFSLVAFSFGYGFASHAWGLFPKTYVEQAWQEAQRQIPFIEDPQFDFAREYSYRKVYDRQGARTIRPGDLQPGLTVITSWWKTPSGPEIGMKLVNRDGTVLHEWVVDRMSLFQDTPFLRADPTRTDIHGSVLLPSGDVVVNLEYAGMARLNSCGEVVWALSKGAHHSISRAEDGSFWVPATDHKQYKGRNLGYPGLESIWLDRILHVSEEGDVLEDIRVLDILYANDLEHLLFQYDRLRGDVIHTNDVEPLDASLAGEYPLFDTGDLLVSLRWLNLVFVSDPETMEVKWHASDPFVWQHDPDFLGDGWIGVFDNNRVRGEATGEGSRIIAFQPHTDSVDVLFQPAHLDRFYTHERGKWQQLENGNMLLTEAATGRVVEVSPDGRAVWEWIHEPYGTRVPSVTKATRVDLTREEVASWPCSSVDSTGTTPTQSQ